MFSYTEENYIKAIFSLNQKEEDGASTNAIAEKLETKASSVSDMMKKLSEKGIVDYKKYQGPKLTLKGKEEAISIIRKHRLWETFLVEKLGFKWDEVHEIAEELEHIRSEKLTDRLDKFLNFPRFDPHGDPIPDKKGNIEKRQEILLEEIQEGEEAMVVGVKDSSSSFLKFLEKVGLLLGTEFQIKECFEFDNSRVLQLKGSSKDVTISDQVASNLYVKRS